MSDWLIQTFFLSLPRMWQSLFTPSKHMASSLPLPNILVTWVIGLRNTILIGSMRVPVHILVHLPWKLAHVWVLHSRSFPFFCFFLLFPCFWAYSHLFYVCLTQETVSMFSFVWFVQDDFRPLFKLYNMEYMVTQKIVHKFVRFYWSWSAENILTIRMHSDIFQHLS